MYGIQVLLVHCSVLNLPTLLHLCYVSVMAMLVKLVEGLRNLYILPDAVLNWVCLQLLWNDPWLVVVWCCNVSTPLVVLCLLITFCKYGAAYVQASSVHGLIHTLCTMMMVLLFLQMIITCMGYHLHFFFNPKLLSTKFTFAFVFYICKCNILLAPWLNILLFNFLFFSYNW